MGYLDNSLAVIDFWAVDEVLLIALIRTGREIPPNVFIPLSLEEVTTPSLPLSTDPAGRKRKQKLPKEEPPAMEFTITMRPYDESLDMDQIQIELARQALPEMHELKTKKLCKQCRHAPQHLRCSQCRGF